MRRRSRGGPTRRRPVFERLEDRLPLDGDLDPAFGSAGLVTTDFYGKFDLGYAAAIQPDGKIVVAGSSGPSSGIQSFALARFNANGSLDDGSATDSTPGDQFGTAASAAGAGRVFDHSQFLGNNINDVLIQPDGKIVVAGKVTLNGGIVVFGIVRFNSDGSLDDGSAVDTTPGDQFGTAAGRSYIDFGFVVSEATAIARQSDGKLVVAGQVRTSNASDYGFGLVRLNTDGSLDDGGPGDLTPADSFGLAGKVMTEFGTSFAGAGDVLVQPDGKIVAVGSSGIFFSVGFAVARYDVNGNLDPSFDGDGRAKLNFGTQATEAILQADGKLIVAGAAGQNLLLARLNANGSLDDGGSADATPGDRFGGTGIVFTSPPSFLNGAEGAVLQADGKIVVAGRTGSAPDRAFALARYNIDGSLDDGSALDSTPGGGFGVAGHVTTNFGGGSNIDDLAYTLLQQPDRKLVVTGTSGNDFAVARYLNSIGAPPPPPDTDRDGISDEIEAGAPNGGDGNSDGLPDGAQAYVTSLPNAIDGAYVTLVAPSGSQLNEVRSSNLAAPHSVTFPIGALAFELAGAGPGVTTVTLLLPPGVAAETVFKFGPTPNDRLHHWYSFGLKAGALVGAEVLPDRVHLHLRDGDLGDDDLDANGLIVDDFAAAVDRADLVAINGVVFHDVNGDSNYDGPFLNEVPLADWTVFLDENANGLLDVASTSGLPTEPFQVTGETGTYGFGDLQRQTYTVTEIPPPGWISSMRFNSRTIAAGTVPRSVAAGDFNSDGRPDLVLVENFQVTLLIARADGTYDAPVVISGASADAVVVGHFNDDPLLDIAIRGATYVSVFLGSSSGEFADPVTYALDGGGPYLLIAGDLEGDGDDDLVVNSSDRAIAVLLGNGGSSGSFSLLPPIDIGDKIGGLALGHLNPGSSPGQDLQMDVAVSSSAGKIVNILSIGTASQTVRETTVAGRPGALVIGQFSLRTDTNSDIAFINRDTSRMHVLLQDTDGEFTLAAGHGYPLGDDPASIQAADFNSDQFFELSVVNTDSDDVSILQGLGDGSFLPFSRIGVGNSPLAQLAADVTGDGLPDLAVPNRASGTLSILARDSAVGQSLVVRLGERPTVLAHFANQTLQGGSIRGTRWDDLDGDGVRDAFEPVLAGHRVFLDVNDDGEITGGVDRAAATDDDGVYAFTNMPPGDYRLLAELGLSEVQTFPAVGGHTITLDQGQQASNQDFGSQFSPGSIRGFVWDDQNGNGVRDNADGFDESGQSGVSVFLDFNDNGRLDLDEPSRVTGLTGEFVFAAISAGHTYPVAEIVPIGFVQSFPGMGSSVTQQVELAADATALANFGNAALASFSGTKWTDTNGNGLPDGDEPRASGVTVFVDLNFNGALDFGEPSGVTDSDGVYVINNVPPGTHTVTDQTVRSFGSPDSTTVGLSFGFSLATLDGKIVVGDPQLLQFDPLKLMLFETGGVHLFDAISGDPLYTLANGVPEGFFGFSVAGARNTLAIGAPGMDHHAFEFLGSVYIVNATTGLTTRSVSFGVYRGNLGTSLSTVEPYQGASAFALGAPGLKMPGYVGLYAPNIPEHHPNDLNWIHAIDHIPTTFDALYGVVSSFEPENPEPGVEQSDFGESVAGLGNLVAAGDPASSFGGPNAGIVRLLDLYSGALVRTIPNPTPAAADNFGAALTPFGFDLLVGAPGDDLGASETGAAYLFNADTGALRETFANPTPASFDQFGFALTAVGNYVVVGAPHDDTLGENAGAAYVFDGRTGQYLHPIFSPIPRAGAEFGFALAAAGDHQVLIGAPSVADEVDPGAAFLFDLGLRVTVAPGQRLDQVDFAPSAPAELPGIRGVAFNDFDQDGQFDAGEPVLDGRFIFLDLNDNQMVEETEPFLRTDSHGNYEFLALRPGTYHVVERVEPGWIPTGVTVSQTVVVTAGEITNDVNFGSVFGNLEDGDADGVINTVEVLAPNHGDGNSDRIPDSDQVNVASLPTAIGDVYLTLASAPGTQLIDVRTFEDFAPSDEGPFAFRMPVGIVSFTLAGISPGALDTLELFLESSRVIDSYYKVGPTLDNPTPHVYEFLFDGTTGAELFDASGNIVAPHSHGRVSRILLHLQDGGRGDDDPTPARIHDPGGPTADFVLPLPPTSPQIFASDTVLLGQDLSTLLGFTTFDDETFSAEIRWGDGLTESFPVDRDGVDAWVTTRHRFLESGTYDIEATVQGTNGFRDTAAHTIQVIAVPDVFESALLVPNAARPGSSTLIIGGSNRDDRMHVSFDPTDQTIRAKLNDSLLGTFFAGNISLVVALGHRGNDRLEVDPGLLLELVLVGGEGDDELVAMPANTAIFGGPGNDSFELSASEFSLDLEKPGSSTLAALETIDIAGGSHNTLVIGANTASAVTRAAGRLTVLASQDDIVQLRDGFTLEKPVFVEAKFFHVVSLDGAEILLGGLHPWRNPINPVDVNADNAVTPIDALVIINELNSIEIGRLPVPPAPERPPSKYVDTTGDDFVTPIDVLWVINFLIRNASAEGDSAQFDVVSWVPSTAEPARMVPQTTIGTTIRRTASQSVAPGWPVPADTFAADPRCQRRMITPTPIRVRARGSQEERDTIWNAAWQEFTDWTLDVMAGHCIDRMTG